jgi:hypothetical protein
MGESGKQIEDGWTEALPWRGQYVLDEQGSAIPAKSLLSWAQWLEEHALVGRTIRSAGATPPEKRLAKATAGS